MTPTHAPTHSPSISQSPSREAVTAAVLEEEVVFKLYWLIGSLVVVVSGIAVLAFFQSRAGDLIKKRHEVALEIADTNY
jgi:hypothetical protein